MTTYSESHKRYYQKHKEKIFKKAEINRLSQMIRIIKNRANKKGIEFTITEEDIFIPEYCPILGVKLDHSYGKGLHNNCISLDRIDPTKGYIKGNVWVISDLANRMKNNASKEELVIFANSILKLFGEQLD